jgi:transposase
MRRTKRYGTWYEHGKMLSRISCARDVVGESFLLRHGKRPVGSMKAWTGKYMDWLQRKAHFEIAALESTFLDYVHEVSHQAERIQELEKAIDTAIPEAPAQMRAVIEALQSLRGVAKITAVTIFAEVGSFSRFE